MIPRLVVRKSPRNDEVHWFLVKRLLKRLGIGPEEWLRAVYG